MQKPVVKPECPETAHAPSPLPGTSEEDLKLATWLGRYSDEELDQPWLTIEDIQRYDRQKGRQPGTASFAQRDLREPPDPDAFKQDVIDRLNFIQGQLVSGAYEYRAPHPQPKPATFEEQQLTRLKPEVRIALQSTPLRCGPYPGPLFKAGGQDDMDRNACSMVHPQEAVQIVAQHSSGMKLARTRYAMGFLDKDAALSAPLDKTNLELFVAGPRVYASQATTLTLKSGTKIELPAHTSLPVTPPGKVRVASEEGILETTPPSSMTSTERALTRRAVLSEAFSFLGEPYGFGGQDGGRDCSRLLLDLFESFDIALPRHSGWQAQSGTYGIELPGNLSVAERLAKIDEANHTGIVLLHLPGHIMLYLGRNQAGKPMALHSLGEYVTPCGNGKETIFAVRKVVVSDLTLGKGSSRRSLAERLTRLVVFGKDPHAPTEITAPKAEECRDSAEDRIFYSPAEPLTDHELRVIATSSSEHAGARLVLWSAEGERIETFDPTRLGGPPFTHWVRHIPEATGPITAALVAQGKVIACKRIAVRHPQRPTREFVDTDSPVWTPRWKWEEDTDNLWSAFIEQLFDDPATDETTWNNLHSLLRDPSRNLLLNHLGENEDARLVLEPDCADLPYMLRAYFSWKLRLPFAFRRCSRGRTGQPPSCGPLKSSLMPRTAHDDVTAFYSFTNRVVRSGVHSASGRTAPQDSVTDTYPVPLTRAALAPGTVYADPYGHVLIVSKWYSQGRRDSDQYGVLMAAEAQPDGTIGRRRFWQGSFLFDPDTSNVGAGFKQFRRLIYDPKTRELSALSNEELNGKNDATPFSMEQYGLTREQFYDRMDALINPNPLDPIRRQKSLVDALEEAVRRRVISVDNAISYEKQGGKMPIAMPEGHAIFETTGPWEDFSTPARDMRLLIAIDTVTSFASKVVAHPERYGTSGSPPSKKDLKDALSQELLSRRFTYVRSDGSDQELSLADVVDRANAFEMAYNPNDCIEIRWAAPEGSQEGSTCRRHAPGEQTSRMKSYRKWFAQRKRPPRGTR